MTAKNNMGDVRHQGEILMSYIEVVENVNDYQVFENLLMRKLEQGAKQRKIINVSNLRNIGKTYALLKFSKYNNYICLHNVYEYPSYGNYIVFENYLNENNKILQKHYQFTQKQLYQNKYVIDEDCIKDSIYKLNLNIVTGYRHQNKFENNFSESVIETLKNEIECLIPKIKKARESNEVNTYKNLIIAFKEVLDLIKNYES